jgi:hypothetical protein
MANLSEVTEEEGVVSEEIEVISEVVVMVTEIEADMVVTETEMIGEVEAVEIEVGLSIMKMTLKAGVQINELI